MKNEFIRRSDEEIASFDVYCDINQVSFIEKLFLITCVILFFVIIIYNIVAGFICEEQ